MNEVQSSFSKVYLAEVVKKFTSFNKLQGLLRVLNSPPVFPIPSQINPIHILTYLFFKIRFKIILPLDFKVASSTNLFRPKLSKRFLS